MTTIRRDLDLDAAAEAVWDAVADFHAVHRRVAPGFLVDLVAEDGARVLTFADGLVARELLVGSDPVQRRLAYAIVSERVVSYAGSIQIEAREAGGCRLTWIVDVLPDALGAYVERQMDAGCAVMKPTLDACRSSQIA